MRLFAFFGSLIVLALAAALIVPPYVDWNQFRDQFEQEAGRALGLPVKVLGQTSARLLPLPSVTFTKLQIGGAGDDAPLFTAETFKLDVELAPLLKGDVVIVDMQLSYPAIKLRMEENGQIKLPQITGQRGEFENADVALENIFVSNGVLQLEDVRSNRTYTLQDIDLQASAKALSGPWRLQGMGTYGDDRFRLKASTGLWQESQQMRLKLALEPQSLPYDFEFDGPLLLRDHVPSLTGRLRVSPMAKQGDQDRISFRRPDVQTALPIRLESELNIASAGATAPAFKLEIGARDDPYIISGDGQAVFGKEVAFRIRAEGQQVNVARLQTETVQGTGFVQRIAALRDVLSRIPKFRADGEINLFLPAVVAGDTVIREVGMDIKPAANGKGWRVRNLEAQLPGRTDLRADGQLLLGQSFGYEGELILASKQPSGFAKWLGSDVSAAIRDLPSAGFSAQAKISEELVQFDDAEIILGDKLLTGNIRRERKEGMRPVLVAKLAGDAVDFDQLSSLFGLFSGDGAKKTVEAHDLDLDLNAASMAISGLQAKDVVARVTVNGDALRLEKLEIGSMAGAALNISGDVSGLPDKPVGTVLSTLVSDNPTRFLAKMNSRFGPFPVIGRLIDDPFVVRDSNLSVTFDGKADGYSVTVSGNSGGSEIEASLSGDDFGKPLDQQQIAGKLVAVNDDASNLLLQFGIPVVPIADVGRGAIRFSASGVAGEGLRSEAALTVRDGYLSVAGLLKPVVSADKLDLNGVLNVTSEVHDADPFILLSGLAIPGFGEGLQAKLSTRLTIDGDQFEASDIAGNLGGAKFTGKGGLDLAQKPRPKVSGSLSISHLDAGRLAGLVYTGTPGSAFTSGLRNGDGVETGGAAQPVLAGLDADVKIDASEVSLAPDSPTIEGLSAQMTVRDGDVSLDDLTGRWLGGTASGTLSMAQTSAARIISGQLKLADGDLAKATKLMQFPDGLSGKLTAAGTFESAGPDAPSMISELTASGALTIAQGKVHGLNANAFADVLKNADTVDDTEIADATKGLLLQTLTNGVFAFDRVDTLFSIASGVVRGNNLLLKNDRLQLLGSARYNLEQNESAFEARVKFDPGKEMVTGASPEFDLAVSIADGKATPAIDPNLFATYLAMRVSERREREFEAQRSEILERQRLLQIARVYALEEEAKRIAEEERERIRQLELEQEAQRKREEARRQREELERKRIEARLAEAERQAAREAALEAGRRERRQQQIDLLRKQSEEAAKRLRLGEDALLKDSLSVKN